MKTRFLIHPCLLLVAFLLARMGGVPARGEGNAASLPGRVKSGVSAAAQGSPLSFESTIQPFIETHCVDCHDAETHKAGLRLDTLAADFRDEKTATPKPHVDFPPPTSDLGGPQLVERSRQWYSIVHLALQTDSTRVVSLWLNTQERPEITGVNLGHHDASHHGQDPAKLEQLALIEEAEIQVLGEFIGKMKASKEGDHTLLDRTAIFHASNLGNSSSHDNNNLPILLAGGGFKHQGHLAFDVKNNTLLSNLYVRMLHHMGIEAKSFGASTGVVSEV